MEIVNPPEIWQREKVGQLNLMRSIEIVATRCQLLRLKCTKFDFGCGSAPDPAVGAYRALPAPLAAFKGFYFYKKTGTGREGLGMARERKGEKEEGG